MSYGRDEPLFAIGVVARVVGAHQHTLRNYEQWGFITPRRSERGTRYYSFADIERIRKIKEWIDTLGLNRAGVEVMIRLVHRIEELEETIAALHATMEDRLSDGG